MIQTLLQYLFFLQIFLTVSEPTVDKFSKKKITYNAHTIISLGLRIRTIFYADPDQSFNINEEPDPTFHFNADPDPASYQSDLRPLAYIPYKAPFLTSKPLLWVSTALNRSIWASKATEVDFNADPDPAFHSNADPGTASLNNAEPDPQP